MIQLQVFNTLSADFEQQLALGAITVTLRLTWNSRSEFWMLSVVDANDRRVYAVKLVPNYLLLRQHKALFPLVGDILLVREDPQAGEYPTFENLGTAFNLYFLNEEEVLQWEDTNGLG